MRDDVQVANEQDYQARVRRVRERLQQLQARKDIGKLVEACGPAPRMKPEDVVALARRVIEVLLSQGCRPAPA